MHHLRKPKCILTLCLFNFDFGNLERTLQTKTQFLAYSRGGSKCESQVRAFGWPGRWLVPLCVVYGRKTMSNLFVCIDGICCSAAAAAINSHQQSAPVILTSSFVVRRRRRRFAGRRPAQAALSFAVRRRRRHYRQPTPPTTPNPFHHTPLARDANQEVSIGPAAAGVL